MKNSYFLNKRDNIIYDFLINGKGSTKDLLEIINREISEIDPNKQIGLKTLQNDLAKVKQEVGEVEEYYPEGCDKRSPHIRFKYPQKILNSIGLTKSQKNSLIDSFVFLERFVGKPGWEWVEDIIDQSNNSFNIDHFLSKKISYAEPSNSSKKIKRFLTLIKESLFEEIPLNILRNLKGKQTEYEIHPHYLKLYRNKWYLFGIDKNKKYDILVLPVDERILAVRQLRKTFISSKINFEEPIEGGESYFDSIIGVTNISGKKIKKVILKIHKPDVFEKITNNKPHHSFEIIDSNPKNKIISISVKENRELLNFIKENIDGIEVVKPATLRKKIKKMLQDSLNKY